MLLIIRNYYIGKYCVTAKLYAIFIFPSQLTSRMLVTLSRIIYQTYFFAATFPFIFTFRSAFRVLRRVHRQSRRISDKTRRYAEQQRSSLRARERETSERSYLLKHSLHRAGHRSCPRFEPSERSHSVARQRCVIFLSRATEKGIPIDVRIIPPVKLSHPL